MWPRRRKGAHVPDMTRITIARIAVRVFLRGPLHRSDLYRDTEQFMRDADKKAAREAAQQLASRGEDVLICIHLDILFIHAASSFAF